MTNETSSQNNPHWMPTAAGIFSIVAGSLGLVATIFFLVFGNILGAGVARDFLHSNIFQNWGGPMVIVGIASLMFILIDILAIVGGIYALQRKNWPFVLTGAIAAVFASPLLGVLAVIFTTLSKKDFTHQA